ncbi:MAG TPA: hypothetical protein VGQ46_00775 [Thermoanaerobaculia bacterium]|jgi:hypothetical protein|nr:hypothetical protein [Thermoanaerobaculia bacterium]
MSRRVTIVFDAAFGDRLLTLVMRTPVWIVESGANRSAVAEAMNRATEWPHISVTVFRPTDDLKHVLSQIGHPQRVDVIGLPLDDDLREVMRGVGFTNVIETADGFRAM